ncbi:hypothetical protein PR202_ga26528 [Eleusine coracana subsp. coracana]|uniref:Peroxisomal membrane protein n=1 Tax=Eleusine coracana subsp. coracana TaxID=191504 RepID=A0AAV5DF71_ELECO|nr:hypothetical protein PR202_ga26528 [Eleusine coracana subsp. coracana]
MSSAVVNGLAGAGGGIIAQIITYPLQTVNTRQQTERSAKKKKGSSRGTDGSSLFQMLQLIQTEGWGGLYSGLKPSLVGTAASLGIYYYFYQILKNRVEDLAAARGKKGLGDGTVGMFSWLGIAAVAGSINVLLTNPIWVLVTRMQIREVYRESGIRGFWKGIVPTLIMVCNPSIQFMIYETLAKRLQSKRSGKQLAKRNLTAMEVLNLQAIRLRFCILIRGHSKAGSYCRHLSIASCQVKVIRPALGVLVILASSFKSYLMQSRLQAKQEIGRNVTSRYTGTIDAILKMIRYEGFHGFYKGMGTKIVQSVFAASVLFMVKEELVKLAVLLVARSRSLLITTPQKR